VGVGEGFTYVISGQETAPGQCLEGTWRENHAACFSETACHSVSMVLNQGDLAQSQGHLETVLVVTACVCGGILLGTHGQRPGVLLETPQCTGQPLNKPSSPVC
jgi:hypothetical protein